MFGGWLEGTHSPSSCGEANVLEWNNAALFLLKLVVPQERTSPAGCVENNGDVCMATVGILGNGFYGTGWLSQSTPGK